MNRILAIALGSAALLLASSPAAAAPAGPQCICQKAAKHRVHRKRVVHHRRTAVRRTATVVTETPVVATVTDAVVPAETYVAPESAYLPDPSRPGRTPWMASADENRIADDLNKSLDVWRTCGWSGAEQPAAAFVAWSRTHLERDPGGDSTTIAWKPFGYDSFGRTEALTDPRDRSVYCRDIRPERTELRARMDQQMKDLAHAHALAHRP